MCGRYTQTASVKELRERFGVADDAPLELKPRYNIAPTQEAPVIVDDDGRKLALYRWGLIPSWAKDPALGHKLINARAETVAEKPSFRKPFQARRCLVPADGFYEWRRIIGGGKVPTRIVLPARETFAMAGLWDSWKGPDGKEVRTFAILTTEANAAMRPVHDRMPVILTRQGESAWLSLQTPAPVVEALLKPWSGELETYAVSPLVNSPRNDAPELIEPARKDAERPYRDV
jgi:putative SOS response-associated peptidase YedK